MRDVAGHAMNPSGARRRRGVALAGLVAVSALLAAAPSAFGQTAGPSNSSSSSSSSNSTSSAGGHLSSGGHRPDGAVILHGQTYNESWTEDHAPRRSRRVIVVEEDDDEDLPIVHRRERVEKPRRTATRGPIVTLPPPGETRYVPGEVLIEAKSGVDVARLAARRGLRLVESRPIRLTGTTLHRLAALDGRGTRESLERLRSEGAIASAQPNWVYTLQQPATAAGDAATPPGGAVLATAATGEASTAPLPGQYAAAKLQLDAAHARAQGRGVLVAVIDTGADAAHPELAGAIEASFDALTGVDPAPGAHGTAMAGAIAARVRLSSAAPAARLLTARAFGPPGARGVAEGVTFNVVTCLDWSVEHRARVLSMSFAGPADTFMARMIQLARARGVVPVAASGNAGPQSAPLHPAATPGVLAVTASDADDHILPQAVRGNHVAVTAPGVDVLVPAPRGGYDLTTGTSVAAAEVSGVVALLLEARPDLAPDAVGRILAETAIDLGAPGRDPVFGAGLVDAAAAVARAR
jgi:hypothetical protein